MRAQFCFVFLAAIVASACGDDYVPPPSTGGTGGTGGTAGTGGTGETGGTGGTAGTGGTGGIGGTAGTGGMGGIGGAGAAGGGGSGATGGTASMGACDNPDDLAALRGLEPGEARQTAAGCGLPPSVCATLVTMEDAFKACVDDCARRATGVSPECSSCYGDLAWCSRELCLTPCAGNACVPDCYISCPGYAACLDALSQCAGRDATDCVGDT